MKSILLFVFLLPLTALAQKGFFDVQAGMDFPKAYRQSFSGRISAGPRFDSTFAAGFGAGVTKLHGLTGILLPVFANFIITPYSNSKIYPLVTLQPGYGFYNQEINNVEVTGGFTFYGGVGIGSRGGNATVGYGIHTLTINKEAVRHNGFSFRLGVTL
jgi:hypothetical protein